ncbi:GCN5-related N-acetyltransferase [Chloroherpeton thalassium ATCC 35110]|uniref:GCN5-related N-acetyltransferase n=1 Tax=Chloroherpeton thalassium (strain ATCC 35110 / GB-78) TaxID=517418 RepID=B3QYC8_CHLT3|nr:GNAT family N-acetyltransferase [Chloroherpeton thalassium]ACF15094.1 GCN5-related N-acetyltransferase [Chloroherpeton thalassium ATCC 35110]
MNHHYPHYAADFLQYDYHSLPQVVKDWFPADYLKENLQREFSKHLQSMRDDIFAHGFSKMCPIAGAHPDEYKFRLIELDRKRKVMTSVRFKCLDVKQPFIDIVHMNFSPESALQAKMMAEQISEQYKTFSPRWIQFFDTKPLLNGGGEDAFLTHDICLLAAPVSLLKNAEKPKFYEIVTLEPAEDLQIYSKYLEVYAELYRENLSLKDILCKESRQHFEKLRDSGFLYNILVKGKWAGILGVSKRHQQFLYGYEILDVMLSKSFRRKGYAAAIQRRLIERLEAENLEAFYGHISPENQAAITTALKLGSKVIGSWYSVKIN